jgi:hypothetical protein
MKQLTEEIENKLWKDDEFCLEKERKEKVKDDIKIQRDYAENMGVSFFNG